MKEQYSKVKDARDEALKIHSAHLAEATHRAAPQIHSLARTIGGHCLPTGMQEIMLGDDDCNFRRLSSTAQIRQNSKIYDIFSLTPSAMFVFDCIDDSARKYNNLFSKIPRQHLELQLRYLEPTFAKPVEYGEVDGRQVQHLAVEPHDLPGEGEGGPGHGFDLK